MKDNYRICIFTSDRDLHMNEPYTGIVSDVWFAFEPGIEIYCCSPSQLTWKNINRQWNEIKPDYIYLNSMFSVYFTLIPLLLARKKNHSQIILAPRGMLRKSALHYKRGKKKLFLTLFSITRLPSRIHFHATDETEAMDVEQLFGKVRVTKAGNFPGYVPENKEPIKKTAGELRMIFVGRIHPIKNLDFLLHLLPGIRGEVLLTVVGGEEDKEFADRCREITKNFPSSIRVDFVGEVANKNVESFLHTHHIFALPTNGENFGHAIFEALAAGTPVLISDQTPWRNLRDKKAGWDLSLQEPAAFTAAIQQAVDFNQHEFSEWSQHAWQYVYDYVRSRDLKSAYQQLFN